MNAPLPKAYKVGYQDFYGRDFTVTPDVLIPRPETEQLIDLVLSLAGKAYLPGLKAPTRILPAHPIILDVGTGSGCIATTVALELPEAKVYATDISPAALKIAKLNAKTLAAAINFYQSDLLDNIPVHPDLIIANLPYVDETWDWLDQKALSHEPALALYAGDHGLALIKKLLDQATDLLIPRLILEADPCQHNSIIQYANKKGFKLIEARGFALYLSL